MMNELDVATKKHFMPLVVDQIYKFSPLLYRIFRVAKEGEFGSAIASLSGRSIVEPLEYGEVATTPGSFGAYDPISDTWVADNQDVLTGGDFDWKYYHTTIAIPIPTVESNKGIDQIIDLAALKLKNAGKKLRKALAEDLYKATFDGSKEIIGLKAICAQSGKVGKIEKSDNSWWKGAVENNTATDINFAVLNDLYTKTKDYGDGQPPTIFVTTDGALQKYENSITQTSVANLPGRLVIGTAVEIDGGFRAFRFKGIPVVSDPFCPAKHLFALNENFLHWRVLKQFASTGWKSLEDQGKDKLQLTIKGYGALTTSCCRKQGVYTNVNEVE